jgi:hypothetical protein
MVLCINWRDDVSDLAQNTMCPTPGKVIVPAIDLGTALDVKNKAYPLRAFNSAPSGAGVSSSVAPG